MHFFVSENGFPGRETGFFFRKVHFPVGNCVFSFQKMVFPVGKRAFFFGKCISRSGIAFFRFQKMVFPVGKRAFFFGKCISRSRIAFFCFRKWFSRPRIAFRRSADAGQGDEIGADGAGFLQQAEGAALPQRPAVGPQGEEASFHFGVVPLGAQGE